MTPGLWLMLAFSALTGALFAQRLRRLARDVHELRSLTKAEGVVEDVESGRGRQPDGMGRGTIRFVDTWGQERRFKTGWSEDVYRVGETISVLYHPTKKVAPRVFRPGALVEIVLTVLLGAALSGGSLAVVVITWLRKQH